MTLSNFEALLHSIVARLESSFSGELSFTEENAYQWVCSVFASIGQEPGPRTMAYIKSALLKLINYDLIAAEDESFRSTERCFERVDELLRDPSYQILQDGPSPACPVRRSVRIGRSARLQNFRRRAQGYRRLIKENWQPARDARCLRRNRASASNRVANANAMDVDAADVTIAADTVTASATETVGGGAALISIDTEEADRRELSDAILPEESSSNRLFGNTGLIAQYDAELLPFSRSPSPYKGELLSPTSSPRRSHHSSFSLTINSHPRNASHVLSPSVTPIPAPFAAASSSYAAPSLTNPPAHLLVPSSMDLYTPLVTPLPLRSPSQGRDPADSSIMDAAGKVNLAEEVEKLKMELREAIKARDAARGYTITDSPAFRTSMLGFSAY